MAAAASGGSGGGTGDGDDGFGGGRKARAKRAKDSQGSEEAKEEDEDWHFAKRQKTVRKRTRPRPVCDECGVTPYCDLAQHRRTHHGAPPLVCGRNGCRKEATCHSTLSAHRKSHLCRPPPTSPKPQPKPGPKTKK